MSDTATDSAGDSIDEADSSGVAERPGSRARDSDAGAGDGIWGRLRRGLTAWLAARPAWMLPAVVVGVVVALPVWGMWIAPGPPMEEGFMLVFPERVMAGDLPNRDFLHLYGPGSLWVLAGTFQVLGVDLWVERLVGLTQIVALVAGVTYANYRWGRLAAAIGGITTALVIMPAIGLTALAWVGGLALGLWACLLASRVAENSWAVERPAGTERTAGTEGAPAKDTPRRRHRLLFLAGLLAGFALLYRPDLVLAVGLPFATLWFWGLGKPARGWLLAGSVTGSSPMLAHFALAGPGNAIQGMLLDPIFELRGGRTLNFPPPWGEYESFLNKAFHLRDWPWPLPTPDGPNQVFLWVVVLVGSGAALLWVGLALRRAALAGGWQVATLALFVLGTFPQAVQRPDTAHLAWVAAVPFGLWPLTAAAWQRWRSAQRPETTAADTTTEPGAGVGPERGGAQLRASARRAKAAVTRSPLARLGVVQAAVPLVVMLAVIPTFTAGWYTDYVGQTFGYNREGNTIEHRDRTYYHGREAAAVAARELLDEVEQVSSPGDRLVVGQTGGPRPEDDTPFAFTSYSEVHLYYLLPQLEPGTYFIEMDPGLANAEGSGLAEEVADADVVILSSLYDDWTEPNDSLEPGSDEPAEVLADEFCRHGRYGEGSMGRPLYELHVRC